MLDRRLRATKARLLRPVAAFLGRHVSHHVLTALAVLCSIGAAIAAWQQLTAIAVVAWLTGRLLDGLDGEVARSTATAGDLGGYVDLLLDTVGYAVVPIGIAFGAGDLTTWRIVAILLATFYVNSVSWLMLSTLHERRTAPPATDAATDATTVAMPAGLIEGTETIVLFTIALAAPSIANVVFVVMAAGVVVGVAQRAALARRTLQP